MGVALAQPPERSPELEPGQRVTETRRPDVRWRLGRELGEEPAERSHEPIEIRIPLGIADRPVAQTLDGASLIRPERHGPTIRLRREEPDVRRDEPQTVAAKAEVLDD